MHVLGCHPTAVQILCRRAGHGGSCVAVGCRPESQELEGDYRAMGVLLALAHEYDMPALTLRIKRMLLPPCDFLEVRLSSESCCSWLKHAVTAIGEAPHIARAVVVHKKHLRITFSGPIQRLFDGSNCRLRASEEKRRA